jgi:replication factor C small subunit
MSIMQELLTEKVRPKKLDSIILTDRVRRSLGDGTITQSLLLAGTQGMGKTSLAYILSKDYPTLYINISSERGIDVVRDKITDFASTRSFDPDKKSDLKVVILDEMDGGTDLLFKALRATMEKFSSTTRFIGTCNYLNKIPDPIQSRFLVMKFDPQNKDEENELREQIASRVEALSKKLHINWKTPELIDKFIDRNFPDIRKIISMLQDLYNSDLSEVTEEDLAKTQYNFLELYNMMLTAPDPQNNYKTIISDFSGKSDSIFFDLTNEFPNWFFENHKNREDRIPALLQAIAEWDYRRKFLIDENLGLIACLFQCQSILNTK